MKSIKGMKWVGVLGCLIASLAQQPVFSQAVLTGAALPTGPVLDTAALEAAELECPRLDAHQALRADGTATQACWRSASRPGASGTPQGRTATSSPGTAKLPWEDYDKQIKARQSISALSADTVFGDHVDLYSGALSFSATDVSLPGNNALPVAIARKFSASERGVTGLIGRDNAFGDWELDLPRVSGIFGPNWHDQRCSVGEPPMIGTVLSGEYWAGNHADMPGGGEMLQATTGTRPKPTGGPWTWVTAGDTYFSCLPAITNGSGEGFLAVTKDGTKYWFNHMAQYEESLFTKPMVRWEDGRVDYWNINRRRNVLYPTRVEDRFGNWVTYTYSNSFSQRVKLTQISSSDGRSLTLGHDASSRITSVSDGSRTWTYQYTGNSLSRVNLPDSSHWTIDFAALSVAEIQHSSGDEASRTCHTPVVVISGDIVGTITSPSGAKGTFTVGPTLLGRTNVPRICVNWTPISVYNSTQSDDFPYIGYRWAALTLKSRKIEGPGLNTGTWTYNTTSSSSYALPVGHTQPVCQSATCLDALCTSDSCAGTRVISITDPDGHGRGYVFGNSYKYNEGKLLQETRGSGGATLQTVTHTYDYAISGQPYPSKIGTSPQNRGDQFTAEYPRALLKTRTTQQGVDFDWTVDNGCSASGKPCLDNLLRPTKVTLSSTISGSPTRTETTQYHDNLALWVVGQVSQVSAGGLLATETSYDATYALPLQHKAFGAVQQTLGWETSATVATGQRGTLKTVADGKGNTTSLSNWYRGVPRAVTHPDASTESALVNAQGWITQATDENGYISSYGYDSLGRITSITPPGGFTGTTASFSASAVAQYGLPVGHWVHTVSKGQARTLTYFDALWRPVMVRTYDNADQANTRKVVVKAYDASSRVKFDSYPQRDFTSVSVSSPGRRIQYDALGRPTSTVADSELGNLTTTTAYESGFQTRVTDPKGHVSLQTHWALDKPGEAQLSTLTAALGLPEVQTTTIQRDVFGKPTSITRGGVTRSYVYDAHQRLCKTLEPEVIATVQAYDLAGNVLWRAPGVNLPNASQCNDSSVAAAAKISYDYDPRNRLTSTSYGDSSPTVTRTYWPDGLPKTVSTGGSLPSTWTYGYNPLRQPTTEVLSFGGTNYSFSWAYNTDGNLLSLSYPSSPGGIVVNYAPNALGEPTQVGTYATGVKHHPNGMVSDFVFGNLLVHSQTQNLRGLPWVRGDTHASCPAPTSGPCLIKDEYVYDKNGNLTQIVDLQFGGTNNRSMGYDGLDRLKTASGPNFWGNATYSYDAADNLTVANVGTRTVSLSYNAKNLLSSATINGVAVPYGYDARGNLSGKGPISYSFDLGNRLKQVGSTNGYVYDGHGRRIRVMASDGSTRLQMYSQGGQLLWSTNTGGGRPTSSTAYIHLGGKQIAEWDSVKGVQYISTDLLGSSAARTSPTRSLLNWTGYEPYGYVAVGTKPGPATSIVGYTGHVQDPETDLVYMQQRYYDPIAGRFLSVDPVVTDANTGKLFGRYHYAENNPYRYIDPTGRAPCPGESATKCIQADNFDPQRSSGRTVVASPSVERAMLEGKNKVAVTSGDQEKMGFVVPKANGGHEVVKAENVKTKSSSDVDSASAIRPSGAVAVIHGHIDGVTDGVVGPGDAGPLRYGLPNGVVSLGRVGVTELVGGRIQFRMLSGRMERSESSRLQRELNNQQDGFYDR